MRWTIFHRRLFSPAYVFMLRYGLIRLDCKKMYFFIMFIVSKSDCPSRFDRVDDLWFRVFNYTREIPWKQSNVLIQISSFFLEKTLHVRYNNDLVLLCVHLRETDLLRVDYKTDELEILPYTFQKQRVSKTPIINVKINVRVWRNSLLFVYCCNVIVL